MDTTETLNLCRESGDLRLYAISPGAGKLESFIATSSGTRAICNDPHVYGLSYTRHLKDLCTGVMRFFDGAFAEREAVVVNILRGGLNFGLREALGDAYGWNAHTTCFVSAQRVRDSDDPENWHITENSYKKVYFPPVASFVIGDVVATGTSLRYGLHELIESAHLRKIALENIFFFTYGSPKAREILEEVDARCRSLFPGYKRTVLIYIEGCFTCPDTATPLTVKLTGTDLVKWGALMAPEFVESQYENPLYPIERCIIYDAGSRAFWAREYLEDVRSYWMRNLSLAEGGMTFEALVRERMPMLDYARFGDVDLAEISRAQIAAMDALLGA